MELRRQGGGRDRAEGEGSRLRSRDEVGHLVCGADQGFYAEGRARSHGRRGGACEGCDGAPHKCSAGTQCVTPMGRRASYLR
eukprot:460221-Pleurochrysis_carterae.AAC.1